MNAKLRGKRKQWIMMSLFFVLGISCLVLTNAAAEDTDKPEGYTVDGAADEYREAWQDLEPDELNPVMEESGKPLEDVMAAEPETEEPDPEPVENNDNAAPEMEPEENHGDDEPADSLPEKNPETELETEPEKDPEIEPETERESSEVYQEIVLPEKNQDSVTGALPALDDEKQEVQQGEEADQETAEDKMTEEIGILKAASGSALHITMNMEPGCGVKNGDWVSAGDEIVYQLSYSVTEKSIQKITVTDRLPDGVSFKSASPDGSFRYEEGSHTVVWEFSKDTAILEKTLTVTTEVRKDADSILINEAYLQADGKTDVSNAVYNLVNLGENQVAPLLRYGLNSDVVQDQTVYPGDQIHYQIIYYNSENMAKDIIISNPIDPGVELLGIARERGADKYDEEKRIFTLQVDDVPPQSVGVLEITVEVLAGAKGQVVNQAAVKVGNQAEQKTNRLSNLVADLQRSTPEPEEPPVPRPQKQIASDSPVKEGQTAVLGDRISYRISFVNYQDTAQPIKITDTLDKGVSFVSASPEGSYQYDEKTRQVVWNFENVAAGGEGMAGIVVQVTENAGDMVSNQAGVSTGAGAEVLTNIVSNPAAVNRTPRAPVKAIAKESETAAAAVVKNGSKITYSISYYNHERDARTVTIIDNLDPGVTAVSAAPKDTFTYDQERHRIVWTLPEIPANTEGYVVVTVQVNSKAEIRVDNQAVVVIGGNEGVKSNVVTNPLAAVNTIQTGNQKNGNNSTAKGEPISSNAPKTGDENSVLLALLLLFGSAAAVVYLARRRKT